MKTKPTHGGKRAGAGRPKTGQTTANITIRVRKELKERFYAAIKDPRLWLEERIAAETIRAESARR